MSFATDQPIEFSAYFDATPSDFQVSSNNEIDCRSQIGLMLPAIPSLSSVFFEGAPFDSQGFSHLDNDGSNQAGLTLDYLPFFDVIAEDLSGIFTQ
jgi:hypothetical protein